MQQSVNHYNIMLTSMYFYATKRTKKLLAKDINILLMCINDINCRNHYNYYNRDGRPLTNSEITGMCIGLLMAGQHTSSSSSSWLGFFLAQNKELQVCTHIMYNYV